jgi:RNA polymerase sigma-70 factor (ECF subfamily)
MPETLGRVADISRAMRRRRTDTTNAADCERFELLFDRHRRAVLGYALRRVDQPADAADVLAETFLVAWRKLDDVPAGSAALPWLLAVARRVLANQRRGARRRGGLAERLRGELTAAVPRHGAVPAGDSEQGRLAAALARLPESDRELILLVGWEELEPSQIAVVLGIQPETVRTRLHRARARLREALAVEEGGGPAAGSPPRSASARTPAPHSLDAAVQPALAPAPANEPPAPALARITPTPKRPPHAPARLGGAPPLARRPLTDLAKEPLR